MLTDFNAQEKFWAPYGVIRGRFAHDRPRVGRVVSCVLLSRTPARRVGWLILITARDFVARRAQGQQRECLTAYNKQEPTCPCK